MPKQPSQSSTKMPLSKTTIAIAICILFSIPANALPLGQILKEIFVEGAVNSATKGLKSNIPQTANQLKTSLPHTGRQLVENIIPKSQKCPEPKMFLVPAKGRVPKNVSELRATISFLIFENQSSDSVSRALGKAQVKEPAFNNGVFETIPFLFSATENCDGLISFRMVKGLLPDNQIEAVKFLTDPPLNTLNDVCNPMRVSWMRLYGYTHIDVLVTSKYQLINRYLIDYEACTSQSLADWREFLKFDNN